jgi:catechol 2,3-dioxygenase-like lactoylglutathione lyase family enzyme
MLHHLTLWVPDLARAEPSWRWLLGELGYRVEAPREGVLLFRCDEGVSIVMEQSKDMVPGMLHSRLRPGLNHVAFHVPPLTSVDYLVSAAADHGWKALPIDGHPIAGGADVVYLEDRDGFEVELVAPQT